MSDPLAFRGLLTHTEASNDRGVVRATHQHFTGSSGNLFQLGIQEVFFSTMISNCD